MVFRISLLLLLFICSSPLFAARKVVANCPASHSIFLMISNPSEFDQNVSVTFKGTGTLKVSPSAGLGSTYNDPLSLPHNGPSMTCSTTVEECSLKNSKHKLLKYQNMTVSIGASWGASTEMVSGVTAEITIDEDVGYVVASFAASYGSTGVIVPVPILGGRAF